MSQKSLQGVAVSEGLTLGTAKIIHLETPAIVETPCIDVAAEIARFQSALNHSKLQIQQLIQKKGEFLGAEERKIFEAHVMMIEDPEFVDQITDKIKTEKTDATKAVAQVSDEFAKMLAALPDPYLSERSHDVRDISLRILRNLVGQSLDFSVCDQSGFILVIKDIAPSMVAELDPKVTIGVITEMGGATSHAAILLRNIEIPAIFGAKDLFQNINGGDTILLDAIKGQILVNPSQADMAQFKDQKAAYHNEKTELEKLKFTEAVTKDGVRVYLHANIGGTAEIPVLKKFNPDGVGLFRTEFLFLDRKAPPTEQEQYEIYKQILATMDNRKTIIRTLDIGGDKDVPYLRIAKEENPFLGLRGLRYCLENTEIFRTQIRALLKASVYGSLYVMYPMVTTLDELKAAQTIVGEEKQKLVSSGVKVSDTIKFGIMIEIPAAAIMAEAFAPHVDFFSLGTNDLIQYTTACDRLNPLVKNLYSSFEPSVLRLIDMVSKASIKHGKELSICGEMGGQVTMTPFLLGVGIHHLSMSSTLIPKVKKRILGLTMAECKELATAVLKASTPKEAQEILKKPL
jgi:phosphotransferase system enzyme I (PtsI)